jgi:ubiquinone/menaquinone biosynthesis C-methylase UbiE
VTNKKIDTVENRWDILYRDFPEVYDEFASIGSDSSVNDFIFRTFDFTNKDVVDVGSGTGKSTFAIAKLAKHVIGIEPEESMRRVAYEEANRIGLSSVDFIAGTGEEIPLPDKSVDIVTGFTLAIHPPERFRYFAQEAMRIVRHGGHVISVGVAPFWYGGDLAEVILGPSRVTQTDTEGVVDRILVQEFGFEYADVDSIQDYGSLDRIVRTYGFIFGRKAIDYLRKHNKTTIHWRNRIHFKKVL